MYHDVNDVLHKYDAIFIRISFNFYFQNELCMAFESNTLFLVDAVRCHVFNSLLHIIILKFQSFSSFLFIPFFFSFDCLPVALQILKNKNKIRFKDYL